MCTAAVTLRSRCTIFLWCRYSTPFKICETTARASSSEKHPASVILYLNRMTIPIERKSKFFTFRAALRPRQAQSRWILLLGQRMCRLTGLYFRVEPDQRKDVGPSWDSRLFFYKAIISPLRECKPRVRDCCPKENTVSCLLPGRSCKPLCFGGSVAYYLNCNKLVAKPIKASMNCCETCRYSRTVI